MISLKQLTAEAKRALGPTACVSAKDHRWCEAYRCYIGKGYPPYVVICVRGGNLTAARAMLFDALKGMRRFDAKAYPKLRELKVKS